MKFKVLALILPLIASACTGYRPGPFESVFTGATLGATTGAIIAATDTSVKTSRAIGLGVATGIPVALAFGALSIAYNDGYLFSDSEEVDYAQLRENELEIIENQKSIDVLRKTIRDDTPYASNPSLRGEVFDGRTHGSWYR